MRLGYALVFASVCFVPAAPADEPAKPKPVTTVKEDAERLVGQWRLPTVRKENPLGMIVTMVTSVRFKTNGTGKLTEDNSASAVPYVADFTYKVEERDGTRVLVLGGKAFAKELVVPYQLDGDKLTLPDGKASLLPESTMVGAEVVGVEANIKGGWARLVDKKERVKRLEKWQGSWTVVERHEGGKKFAGDDIKMFNRWTFDGDELAIRDSKVKSVVVIADPNRGVPTISLLYEAGTVTGIYRFDDADTVRVFLVNRGSPLPKSFDPPGKDEGTIFVLKREKK